MYLYAIILKTQTRIRDREWKIQNEREMVMTIKRAWLRAENGAGEKESRVSRVTIRFGTAVVSVGSWALSICNSLYGVRDVCTWLYCIGHGNATRTISNYTMVDGKRSAGRGRIVARVVETLTRFLPLDVPLQGEAACWKFKHLVPRLFASGQYSEGRGEWNFHLT